MVDAHVICVGIFLVGYGRLAMPLYQRGMLTFFYAHPGTTARRYGQEFET